jgi:hypothetical protein
MKVEYEFNIGLVSDALLWLSVSLSVFRTF